MLNPVVIKSENMTPFHDITIGDFAFIALILYLIGCILKFIWFILQCIWDVIGPPISKHFKKINEFFKDFEKGW